MGDVTGLVDGLLGKYVYFDTSPIIYFLDQTEPYFPLCREIFQGIAEQDFVGLTGEVCLAELLVKPLRSGNARQARTIRELFDEGWIRLLEHDRDVFELAAEFRAKHGLKMIDAIHVATAIRHGCHALVTNDSGMTKPLPGLSIISLSHYLPKHELHEAVRVMKR